MPGKVWQILKMKVMNVTNMCRNDELSWTISWFWCLLKDSELFILFAKNSQILLKISVIAPLLTYLVLLNLSISKQSTHRPTQLIIAAHECHNVVILELETPSPTWHRYYCHPRTHHFSQHLFLCNKVPQTHDHKWAKPGQQTWKSDWTRQLHNRNPVPKPFDFLEKHMRDIL